MYEKTKKIEILDVLLLCLKLESKKLKCKMSKSESESKSMYKPRSPITLKVMVMPGSPEIKFVLNELESELGQKDYQNLFFGIAKKYNDGGYNLTRHKGYPAWVIGISSKDLFKGQMALAVNILVTDDIIKILVKDLGLVLD